MTTPLCISNFPPELVRITLTYLSDSDMGHAMLACKAFWGAVPAEHWQKRRWLASGIMPLTLAGDLPGLAYLCRFLHQTQLLEEATGVFYPWRFYSWLVVWKEDNSTPCLIETTTPRPHMPLPMSCHKCGSLRNPLLHNSEICSCYEVQEGTVVVGYDSDLLFFALQKACKWGYADMLAYLLRINAHKAALSTTPKDVVFELMIHCMYNRRCSDGCSDDSHASPATYFGIIEILAHTINMQWNSWFLEEEGANNEDEDEVDLDNMLDGHDLMSNACRLNDFLVVRYLHEKQGIPCAQQGLLTDAITDGRCWRCRGTLERPDDCLELLQYLIAHGAPCGNDMMQECLTKVCRVKCPVPLPLVAFLVQQHGAVCKPEAMSNALRYKDKCSLAVAQLLYSSMDAAGQATWARNAFYDAIKSQNVALVQFVYDLQPSPPPFSNKAMELALKINNAAVVDLLHNSLLPNVKALKINSSLFFFRPTRLQQQDKTIPVALYFDKSCQQFAKNFVRQKKT